MTRGLLCSPRGRQSRHSWTGCRLPTLGRFASSGPYCAPSLQLLACPSGPVGRRGRPKSNVRKREWATQKRPGPRKSEPLKSPCTISLFALQWNRQDGQNWQGAGSCSSPRPYAGALTTHTIAYATPSPIIAGHRLLIKSFSAVAGACVSYAAWGVCSAPFVRLGGSAPVGAGETLPPAVRG